MSLPSRTPKRQPQHPSAGPVFTSGDTLPYEHIYDVSQPRGQFTRSPSEITLSQLMPPPPVPSSQFQTPQSLYFASPSSDSPNYFAPYANYPSNPYVNDMTYPAAEWTDYIDPNFMDVMSQSDMMSQTMSMSDFSMASTSPSKASTSSKTPRPPNAWILYRSDKLKAIAAGDVIPGLDAVMAELNPSSSASPSNDSGDDKKTRQRAPKKGAKPPTEGLLSLGRGKLGRGLPQADISKMISMLWKRESPAIRDKYEQMALFKKREHQLKYPDYKFQPQRKADKVRAREEREREKEAVKREKEAQKGGRAKKTRSKKNRYSPTATSSRNDSVYAPSETGWQVSTPSSLPRLNPFPMPPVSLPSMNAEKGSYDMIMEPNNSVAVSSPERPSTAPEHLPSQPELLHPPYPQPPPPKAQPPLQQQWIGMQAPGPDQPSIIDIGSEMQMQMQPGQSDFTAPPKTKKPRKKVAKINAKAASLAATWGVMEETEHEIIVIDDDEAVIEAQESQDGQEIQMVEQLHTDLKDSKGKKKERVPCKPLTSTQPLVPDLYHIHAGPYTVEAIMPDGQELPAERVEDDAVPPGITIGQWYDMQKEYNEVLVAEPVNNTAPLSTEITAHIETQNGHQVIIPDEWDPTQLQMLQALIEETSAHDQGPTISGAPLLSPMDATWTLSPTDTSFGENINNDPSISRVTSYSVTKNDGTLLPFNVVPRHISSGSDGNWTRDRLMSFGDAGMIFGVNQPAQLDVYEDDFFANFMIAPDDLALPTDTTSCTSTSAPASIGGLEPLAEEPEVVGDEQDVPTAPSSSDKTIRETLVEEQRTPTTRSMRGGMRGRAVGRKFEGA